MVDLATSEVKHGEGEAEFWSIGVLGQCGTVAESGPGWD